MLITVMQSPQQHGASVRRPSDPPRLVILAGLGLRPHEVFQAALPHLEPWEVLPVARACGLPVPEIPDGS